MNDYEVLSNEIDAYHVGNRTRSVALLAWFLERVWRADPEETDSAICDGGGDKGIDAIFVDEEAKDIVVLQGKHRETQTATQGDADLKSFLGTAPYFAGPDGVDSLIASKPNPELLRLVNRIALRDKLDSGDYTVTHVFVTNAMPDASATGYLATLATTDTSLELWAQSDLAATARRTAVPGLLAENRTLPTHDGVIVKTIPSGGKLAIALVPANELVSLPGISNLTLFDLNVRLGLGKTRINKELEKTVSNPAEHETFPAYHNGLTILTSSLTAADDGTSMNLEGLSVVNGCQSLLALYGNRGALTPALEVAVKVVEVEPGSALIDRITYRSNNQNPVNMRDQRANDAAQRQLQSEMRVRFGDRLFYAIRNGEDTGAAERVLDNTLAAQLLTAVYREEPWSAIRKIKLFDDDYYEVFTKHVSADRLFLLDLIDQAVGGKKDDLRDDLGAAFASVRFTLVFLVARILARSATGERLLTDPTPWLPSRETELKARLDEYANEAVRVVNDFVKAREIDVAFDFKVTFKSRAGVLQVETEALHIADVLQSRLGGFDFDIDP